jgi:hypothetical protein
MSDDERKLTAFHEAGHAIVGINTPQHDPIHKATIIPRGRALGLVMSLPERDQLSVTKTKYKSMIAMASVLPSGGLLIRDVAGDLYRLPEPETLDKKSRALLWAFVD